MPKPSEHLNKPKSPADYLDNESPEKEYVGNEDEYYSDLGEIRDAITKMSEGIKDITVAQENMALTFTQVAKQLNDIVL